MDDYIQKLLKKLLATEDLAEFDELSLQLKSALRGRIDALREQARALKAMSNQASDKKRPTNGGKKP